MAALYAARVAMFTMASAKDINAIMLSVIGIIAGFLATLLVMPRHPLDQGPAAAAHDGHPLLTTSPAWVSIGTPGPGPRVALSSCDSRVLCVAKSRG